MMKDSPDQSGLDSGLVLRCTEAERVQVGQMAQVAGLPVSEFCRMAITRYVSALQQAAADRSAADAVIEA